MSTSKLQKKVRDMLLLHLPSSEIEENTKPDWLEYEGQRLELDFYIPKLRMAIEVQGEQHFRYVPFFHKSYGGFRKRKKLDDKKKEICRDFGIRLIEIADQSQAEWTVSGIMLEYYSNSSVISRPRPVEIIFELRSIKRRRLKITRELRKLERQQKKGKRDKATKKHLDGEKFKLKTLKRELIKELEELTGLSIDPTELDRIIGLSKNGDKAWQKYTLKLSH